MRISDWSSDVCSSDLPREIARGRDLARHRHRRARGDARAAWRPLGGGGDGACRYAEGRRRACPRVRQGGARPSDARSEEHTSELQSLMRISYAVFCLKKNKNTQTPLLTQILHHAAQNV